MTLTHLVLLTIGIQQFSLSLSQQMGMIEVKLFPAQSWFVQCAAKTLSKYFKRKKMCFFFSVANLNETLQSSTYATYAIYEYI